MSDGRLGLDMLNYNKEAYKVLEDAYEVMGL